VYVTPLTGMYSYLFFLCYSVQICSSIDLKKVCRYEVNNQKPCIEGWDHTMTKRKSIVHFLCYVKICYIAWILLTSLTPSHFLSVTSQNLYLYNRLSLSLCLVILWECSFYYVIFIPHFQNSKLGPFLTDF
jgi:hypothetical protein